MNGEYPWREIYDGGSPEAEREMFRGLAQTVLDVQEKLRLQAGTSRFTRTLHSKIVIGSTRASLIVDHDIPLEFSVSDFQPDAVIPSAVRLSNASGVPLHDAAPDLRGIALRLLGRGGEPHDLLMTSQAASFARDARQYVDYLLIESEGREDLFARMRVKFGEAEARRMAYNLKRRARLCSSLALERFWSCGAVLWGHSPVRFELRPDGRAAPSGIPQIHDPDALRHDFEQRLARDDVRYRFVVQRYVDEMSTPIEDGSMEWSEDVSPPVEIATLLLPKHITGDDAVDIQSQAVDAMSFNPWNAPPEFRPLGNLNRARGVVYRASSKRWHTKDDPSD